MRTAGLVTCALLAFPGAAVAAPLARSPDVAAVTAGEGKVVWSGRDSRGGYYLTEIRGTRMVRLPIHPRGVPFDADVGRDGNGQVVVAYSRCRTEPTGENAFTDLPTYATGRGCKLYAYDFARKRERRLSVPGPRGGSLYLPAVAGNLVAFGRTRQTAKGRESPELFEADTSAGTVRRLHTGGLPGPVGVDAADGRVVFVWDAWEFRCSAGEPEDALEGLQRSEVWYGAPPRRIENVCADDATSFFLSPSLVGSDVIYTLRRNTPDEATAYRYRRYTPADQTRAEAPAAPFQISAAWTPTALYTTVNLSDREADLRDGYGLYKAPLPVFQVR